MDNAHVQRELTTMLRAASGFNPSTQGWTDAIDAMFDKGATPDDILSRAKNALSHPYYRNKVLDDGAKYINWKFHELSGTVQSSSHKTRTVQSMSYDGYRHKRWEVALHEAYENGLDGANRTQWLESYFAQHAAEADDMVECPSCKQQGTRRGT